MFQKQILCLVFPPVLLAACLCLGQESSAPAAAAIRANNVVILRQRLGKEVTVTGNVARTGKSSSGHQFLNFQSSELTAVCFGEDVKKFKDGHPADLYDGKQIRVTGKLSLYKGKLQLRFREPSQIQVAKASATSKTVGVKLKQIDRDTWISPAGLRYAGRDPMGLTRVEHVLRHANDIKNRDGPHGVFDGDQAVVFAVIDEAWRLADRQKLKPRLEGRRSSYTVRMGRRVGYLGGRLGASKRHPPLGRVFIVFETGTKNIVTAFPK